MIFYPSFEDALLSERSRIVGLWYESVKTDFKVIPEGGQLPRDLVSEETKDLMAQCDALDTVLELLRIKPTEPFASLDCRGALAAHLGSIHVEAREEERRAILDFLRSLP